MGLGGTETAEMRLNDCKTSDNDIVGEVIRRVLLNIADQLVDSPVPSEMGKRRRREGHVEV